MPDQEPIKNLMVIKDLETLRVVADPLRAQILELLAFQPATIRQIAGQLGLAPSRLYYHVNMLEKHGLVRVEETRMVSNMVEKVYTVTASDYTIDINLIQPISDQGKEGMNQVLTSTLDVTREDILRSIQAGLIDLDKPKTGLPEPSVKKPPQKIVLSRQMVRIPESRADELRAKIESLLHEFEEERSGLEPSSPEVDSDPKKFYALMLAFYPSLHFQNPEEEQSA